MARNPQGSIGCWIIILAGAVLYILSGAAKVGLDRALH